MSQKPAPRQPPRFDLQRFETMTEPFSVRVDKIKGTTKMEIPMPMQEGSAPGTGWSKDQVREMQTWVVNEWAGGGHYAFAITDSAGQMMEWTAYYPVVEFPEKMPPPLLAATAMAQGFPPPPTPVNQKAPSMASFPTSGSNLPPGSPYAMMPAAVPLPQGSGYAYPPPQQYAPPFGYGYPQAGFAPPQQQNNSEMQALRDQLAAERQANAQRDFERRVQELKADSDRRMAEMQQTFGAMIEKMTAQMRETANARPGAVDPVVEQIREQNRALQEQMARQREEAERTRREAELVAQIRAAQEETRRLVEEANRRAEQFMRESANKGPDQQLLMFQSLFQSQSEAMKEIARNSQAQLDRVQNMMMRPQDILAMAKEASSSSDNIAGTLNRAWGDMFSVQRQVIEQVAQLNNQGGGNEVIGLIRDAASKAAEMAEKYTGSKAKENIAQINASAQVAQAQAEVVRSQNERLAEMARTEQAIKSGVAVQMPDGTWRATGAPQAAIPAPAPAAPSGPGRPPWIPPRNGTAQPAQPAPAAAGGGLNGAAVEPSNVVQLKQPDNLRRIKGRTDVEWFGPILPNIMELRSEVAKFIAGLEQKPPVVQGASPNDCATAINIAAMQLMERQIAIPAMLDLLMQGMVPDFLDVLIPDAPQPYRDDVVKLLMAQGEEEPDEDEDEDEDEAPQAQA